MVLNSLPPSPTPKKDTLLVDKFAVRKNPEIIFIYMGPVVDTTMGSSEWTTAPRTLLSKFGTETIARGSIHPAEGPSFT